MSRAHLTKAVVRRVSGVPADGSCRVQLAGTTTDFTGTLYADSSSNTTLSNPFTFTNGLIDFFTDSPARVKLVVTPSGAAAQSFDQVDIPLPADYSPPNPTLSSLGGAKSTVGAGLPSFAARLQGDLHYDSTAGKEYVLTGVAAGTASAALVGGVVNTAATQTLDLGTVTGATSIFCHVNNDTASDGLRIYFEGDNPNFGFWTQGYFYDIIGSAVKLYPYNGGSPLAVGSLPAGFSVGSPNSYDLTIDSSAGHVVVRVNGIVVLDATVTPASGRYVSVQPAGATPAISVTNVLATKAGTLAWSATSSGPSSTTGFGLPTTAGRTVGDLHYDLISSRESTLISNSGVLTWVPTSGSVNSVSTGLPPFPGRVGGDHHFNSTAGKDYVLTGAAGTTFSDSFTRADSTGLGAPWSSRGGTAANVVSGKAVGQSTGQNYVPLSTGDQTVSVDWTEGNALTLFACLDSSAGTTYFAGVQYLSGSYLSYSFGYGGTTNVGPTATTMPRVPGRTYRVTLSTAGKTLTLTIADPVAGTSWSSSYTDTNAALTGVNAAWACNGTIDNFVAFANGTLAWTPAASGPSSTAGFGLPTTVGRNTGDLHFERFSNREYVLAGGAWTASSGAVNTASSGLPPFAGRVTGDHHFDTASHRDYVLTGVVGTQIGDSFSRATVGTVADTGQTIYTGLGDSVPTLDGTKWIGTSSATNDYSDYYTDLGTAFGTVQVDFTRGAGGNGQSQVTMYIGVDAARHAQRWRVTIGGVLFVADPNGNTLLSENPSTSHPMGSTHTWSFSVASDGVTWTLSRDGVVYASGVGSGTGLGTRVGVELLGNQNDSIDNFQAYSPGTLLWNLAQSSAETIKHIPASGAALTIDDPVTTSTTITRAVLSASCAITLPAPVSAGSTTGKSFSVVVVQAASGGPYTSTFSVPSGNILWGAAGAPTQSTGASKGDMYVFTDAGGGNLLGTYAQGF